jgi:saccharopine dehydrogenase-like NADP-dependent oxidoreductase
VGGVTRRVLVVGAGRVSAPLVRHLLADPRAALTLASIELEDAERLVRGHPRGRAVAADAADPHALAPLVREAGVVISLVPPALHAGLAQVAIAHGVDVVTTSYVSPAMRALDAAARAAGVTLLNEVGLDPGLDHMSAMRLIDRARADGAPVIGFTSYCGSIPAPEASGNPWRYRFAWSPRGALAATRLPARYLIRDRVVERPGGTVFARAWPYAVEGLGTFELYPNRDSLPYVDAYGLATPRTRLRATIRWPGWCETIDALGRLGLLDDAERAWPAGTTFREALADALPPATAALAERVRARLSATPSPALAERLAWSGFDADAPLPAHVRSPLDLVAAALERRLAYAPGERDMVVLHDEILVAAGGTAGAGTERRSSRLVAFGEPGGDSATARTVSLPAAIAAELVLDGTIARPGVHIPTSAAVYGPILDRLEHHGIVFEETSSRAPADWPGPAFVD